MISGKLVWFIAVQLTIFKGLSFRCFHPSLSSTACPNVCCCSNTTQAEEALPLTTPPGETPSVIAVTPTNTSEEIPESSTSNNSSHLEIIEIFHGNPNLTTTTPPPEEIIVVKGNITNCLNTGSPNVTCVHQAWNDTFRTNYTTVAEAVGVSESFPERLQNTAAIAAGIFLVSAVIGYFSCVGYRRFLQRKYGNRQILIGEEVYDTTDLRYFEI